MIFLYVFEALFMLVLLLIATTQLIIPIFKGTRIFPYLVNRKNRVLEEELSKVKEEKEQEELKLEILKEKEKLNTLKEKTKEN